jgi:hypothetical protein
MKLTQKLLGSINLVWKIQGVVASGVFDAIGFGIISSIRPTGSIDLAVEPSRPASRCVQYNRREIKSPQKQAAHDLVMTRSASPPLTFPDYLFLKMHPHIMVIDPSHTQWMDGVFGGGRCRRPQTDRRTLQKTVGKKPRKRAFHLQVVSIIVIIKTDKTPGSSNMKL